MLNSKGEYNRSKIVRLTLGDNHLPPKVDEVGEDCEEDREAEEWEQEKMEKRDMEADEARFNKKSGKRKTTTRMEEHL